MRFPRCGWLLAAFILAAPLHAQTLSPIETRFNQLHGVMVDTGHSPEREQARAMAQAFQTLFADDFAPQTLRKTTPHDLGLLMRAAELPEFHSNSAEDLAKAKAALDELVRRQADQKQHWEIYYKGLVGRRDLDTARKLVQSHPQFGFEPIPAVESDKPPGKGTPYFQIDPSRFVLREATIDLSTGTHLVVVAHALCHFSKKAMETLATDAELSPILQTHTLWLAPVDRAIYFDELQQWNRAHPQTHLVLAQRKTDWPFIDNWATPSFYLVRNGKLVGQFSGWPIETGYREKLIALLRQGGLATSSVKGDLISVMSGVHRANLLGAP